MKRTTRLEQIEQILLDNPDGVRVIELSKRCTVDRRTIYRDLEAMQMMGLPIWQANGRYGIEREQYLTQMRINLNEAFTMLWAFRLLTYYTEMENPHARSLIQKITAALPLELAKQVDAIQEATLPLSPNKNTLQTIEKVTRAWADNLKIMIGYQNRKNDKATRRVIAPYVLDTTPQGKLYIIGMDEKTREIHIFNLERIIQVEVLEDEPFRRIHSFDARQYVTAAYDLNGKAYPETVVLRFQAKAASLIKDRQWYPGQRIETYQDGSCIFIAEVMDWQEIEKWVRSWGAQVEVIAPADFRRTIAAEFKQAANLYG